MSVAHTWDRLGDPLEEIDTTVLLSLGGPGSPSFWHMDCPGLTPYG